MSAATADNGDRLIVALPFPLAAPTVLLLALSGTARCTGEPGFDPPAAEGTEAPAGAAFAPHKDALLSSAWRVASPKLPNLSKMLIEGAVKSSCAWFCRGDVELAIAPLGTIGWLGWRVLPAFPGDKFIIKPS